MEQQQAVFVYPPAASLSAPVQIAELVDARLPQGAKHLRLVNLTLMRGQRIALVGPNGCGKSTLLKVLAGQLPVISGVARTCVTAAYLDQHLTFLQPGMSVLEQLRALNRELADGELRTRLAQLGLNAERINQPCAQLSGGEQLKAAMACVFYAQQPP